jgi:hypothetical protein
MRRFRRICHFVVAAGLALTLMTGYTAQTSAQEPPLQDFTGRFITLGPAGPILVPEECEVYETPVLPGFEEFGSTVWVICIPRLRGG